MQSTTQMSKGELLFEIQGKTVSSTIKEITPHGIRLEMNDEGQSNYRCMARRSLLHDTIPEARMAQQYQGLDRRIWRHEPTNLPRQSLRQEVTASSVFETPSSGLFNKLRILYARDFTDFTKPLSRIRLRDTSLSRKIS